MRRLWPVLLALLGLTLLAAQSASAAVATQLENRTSGSPAGSNNLVELEARLNENAVRENVWLGYEGASGSPVAARSATGGRAFYSGVRSEQAAALASRTGATTLESSLAARGVKLPAWNPNNPASVAAWRQASVEFAQGASGNVRVFQGDALRVDAIWRDEFAALKANPNVSSITSIDAATGAEVLLWAR
jgi:hypothetical protein